MFIQTEATQSRTLNSFPPDRPRRRHHGVRQRRYATRSPLAARLFDVTGVTGCSTARISSP